MTTERIFRGDDAEQRFAFCQVVRRRGQFFVSGMTGRREDGTLAAGDAYAQARQALSNLGRYLSEAGASLEDVVRTRLYVTRREDIAAVARAHREIFASHPPAATLLLVAGLFTPEILIEIEADVLPES